MKTTALLAATAAALAGLVSPVSAGDCEGELLVLQVSALSN